MGAYNAAMDGTLGGNGNFLCRRATCANVCFPRVIIPSACTYDESKLVLTKNRPISYIKILTWLRGEGGGGGGGWERSGVKGELFIPRRDFLCFIPLSIGAKLEFQYLEICPFMLLSKWFH